MMNAEFYCNSLGELFHRDSQDKPVLYSSADDLPSAELKELYNRYWTCDYSFCTYVVECGGVPGINIGFEFPDCYLEDFFPNREIPSDFCMKEIVDEVIGDLNQLSLFDGCGYEVYESHEVEFYIFIPYRKRYDLTYIYSYCDYLWYVFGTKLKYYGGK